MTTLKNMLTYQHENVFQFSFFNRTDLTRIINKVTLSRPLNTLLYIIKFKYEKKNHLTLLFDVRSFNELKKNMITFMEKKYWNRKMKAGGISANCIHICIYNVKE